LKVDTVVAFDVEMQKYHSEYRMLPVLVDCDIWPGIAGCCRCWW